MKKMISISPDVNAMLEVKAQERQTSMSRLIEHALIRYLGKPTEAHLQNLTQVSKGQKSIFDRDITRR